MQENPLWQYSLHSYQKPGVKPLLLALQDEIGADVNLLLCCCWLGQQQLRLSAAQLSRLQGATAAWQRGCVLPLRSVRRFLKGQADQSPFRGQVQALELQAEQQQQAMLYQQLQAITELLEPADGDVTAVMQTNLQGYLSAIPGLDGQEVASTMIELIAAIIAPQQD